jgi:hypothetical protein
MAKATPDAILDAMADAIIAAINTSPSGKLYVCSSEPANYGALVASPSITLASVNVDTTDFTKADGDSGGRKVTIAQQSSIPIVLSGTATHVALASTNTLLYVTTCTSQALTSGGTVTVPAWKITVADPT